MEKMFVPGMPRSEYEKIDAINWSVLRHIKNSPAHLRLERDHPREPNAAMIFGSAVHCAILEPERFMKEYAPAPDGVGRRKKEDRDKWDMVEKANPGAEVLKATEWDAIQRIKGAVLSHPTASMFLSGPGKNEVAMVWHDTEYDLWCKAIVDRIAQVPEYGSVLVDLKTAECAAEWAFAKSAAEYQYPGQAAYYLRGANYLSPLKRRFIFVVAEKVPPYGVCCYELEMDDESEAEKRVRRYLGEYNECKRADRWPAYTPGVHPLRLPVWALKENA
jgi:hypothetical protein